MKEIPLTQGKVALVDDADYDWLMQWKWFARASRGKFYAMRKIKTAKGRGHVFMHNIILPPDNERRPDHINGNGLDNQRGNLRLATQLENTHNAGARKDGRSPYKGVIWHGSTQRWRARITVNKQRLHLGTFTDQISAAHAYDAAARIYHGVFARTNF